MQRYRTDYEVFGVRNIIKLPANASPRQIGTSVSAIHERRAVNESLKAVKTAFI